MNGKWPIASLALSVIFAGTGVRAAETSVHGILDVRASAVDGERSYLDGGHGKFGYSDGQQWSLAQAGLALSIESESGLAGHLVLNGYLDDEDSAAGVTEAYIKYKSLPNAAGYRWQNRTGIFYPEISLENNAYAWASKDTLNSSTLNTWIGEEIRVLGSEFKLTRLGKWHDAGYDLSLSATLFVNNDPAGALLSWHGWTQSARQTLWTEQQPIPWFRARKPGYRLEHQAANSDPFLELDNRPGAHVLAQWQLTGKGELSFGYYDNHAKPYVIERGQYGWHTRFYHAGAKWHLGTGLNITAQYLRGDSLMQSPSRIDVVNMDYASGFVALTKQWQAHKLTARVEEFSIDDRDDTEGDDNNEYGKGLTLNYSYRLAKPCFVALEYNWLDSERPGRSYGTYEESEIERQWQLALRYFF